MFPLCNKAARPESDVIDSIIGENYQFLSKAAGIMERAHLQSSTSSTAQHIQVEGGCLHHHDFTIHPSQYTPHLEATDISDSSDTETD